QARGRTGGAGRQVAAVVAALTLAGALLPPLDRVAAALLSAHMGQHVLLTLVAAPLLALAQPLNVALAALPRAWRPRRLPGARLPVAAAALAHAGALWAWHLPPLYDLALASPLLHALEHATLMATAVWLWWAASRQRPAGALALFATALHAGALGALLTLAPRPWFAAHQAGGAGLSALEDQQLAGILMWVPAGTLLTGFALALLAAWFRQAERRTPSLMGPRTLVLVVLPLLTLLAPGCNRAAPTATLTTGRDPGRRREAVAVERDLGGEAGAEPLVTIPPAVGAPREARVALARDGEREIRHADVDDVQLLAPAGHHAETADRQRVGEHGRGQVHVEAAVERRHARAVRPHPVAGTVAGKRERRALVAEHPGLQRAHAPAGIAAQRIADRVGAPGGEPDGDGLRRHAGRVAGHVHGLETGARPRLPEDVVVHLR